MEISLKNRKIQKIPGALEKAPGIFLWRGGYLVSVSTHAEYLAMLASRAAASLPCVRM